jgi:hypothetical protein
VHLANAIPNQFPTWQLAVIANGQENLQTLYRMDGAAPPQSILSWALTPTNYN